MRTRRYGLSRIDRLTGMGSLSPAPPSVTWQANTEGDPATEIAWTLARIGTYGGIFEYREVVGGSWTTIEEWSTDGADPTTSGTITGLDSETEYEYRAATKYGPSDTLLSSYRTGSVTTDVDPTDNTLYHVLVTGQSNANGVGPILSTGTPAFTPLPLKFSTGVRAGDTSLTSLVTLVEDSSVESICSGFAKRFNELDPSKQLLFSISALSDARYTTIKQGTATYDALLDQVTAAKAIADAASRPYRVLAVIAIHGEAETQFGTTTAQYTADLIEWQDDLDTDIKVITSQAEDIPLFACQQSYYGPTSYPSSNSAQSVYEAWKTDNAKVVLIGSRYPCREETNGSRLHIAGWGQRWHGQRYAKAVYERLVAASNWKPLSPSSVTISSATITLVLNVPNPPVRLAYDYVGKHPTWGFKFHDDSGTPPTVTNVVVANSTTLTITLSGTPSGTAGSFRLRYAWGNGGSSHAGDLVGNVCDTSGAVSSIDGLPLDNWLVAFEEVVS